MMPTVHERAWQVPIRLIYGLFFLHTGMAKAKLDAKGAAGLHRLAAAAYPKLKSIDPTVLCRAMSVAETAIAASLLTPIVPPAVGGAGLSLFGAGLAGVYLRVPGMRRQNSIRPTEAGLGLAKDWWMIATGLALVIDVIACSKSKRSVP